MSISARANVNRSEQSTLLGAFSSILGTDLQSRMTQERFLFNETQTYDVEVFKVER
jgi:hypothetical protein